MHSSMRRTLAFAVSACLGFGVLVGAPATSASASEPWKPTPTPSVSTANNTLVFETEKPESEGSSSHEKSGSEDGSDSSEKESGSGEGEDDSPVKVAVNFSLVSLLTLFNGQPHPVTYSVTAPNGSTIPSTITYNGSASAPSAVGNYTVVVTCQTTKYVCTNSSAILVIAKAPQVISVSPTHNLEVGQGETLSATGGNSGNAVVLSSNSTGICTVSGWHVEAIAAGVCHLQFDQSGNASYLDASPLALSLTITDVPVVTPPTPGPTPDPTSSSSPAPTSAPTIDPTPTVEPTPTTNPSPTTTPSQSPEPSHSSSPSPSQSASSSPSATPTQSSSPTASPSQPSVAAPSLSNARDIEMFVQDSLDRFELASNSGDASAYQISPALPAGLILNRALGTVSGTAETVSARQPYTLTATNSSGSASITVYVTVAKHDQRISVSLPSTVTYGDGNISVRPRSTSGLSVAYYSSNNSVLQLNADGSLTPVGAGISNIVFTQPGSATFNAAPVLTVTIIVKPRTINLTGVTVTVDKNGNVTFTGGNLDGVLPGDLVGFNGSGVSGSYNNSTLSQSGRFTLSGKDAANYILNQPNNYDVKVETSNNSGQTPWAPLDFTPVESQPKNGHATVGGFDVAVVLRSNTSRNGLEFLAPGWQLGLGATDANGKQIQLGADGTLRVQRDHTFVASGAGFAPNSTVKLFIFSTALALGDVSTDSRGAFDAAVAVPDSLETGLHTLQVVGYSPTGQNLTGDIPVTLVDSASAPVATLQKYTNIVYFNPGNHKILKRSTKQLRKLITLLGSGLTNPKVTLTAYNSRKDVKPTSALAVSRLRSVALSLRSKIATTAVTRNIGQTRRNHWGYVRFTVTYTK